MIANTMLEQREFSSTDEFGNADTFEEIADGFVPLYLRSTSGLENGIFRPESERCLDILRGFALIGVAAGLAHAGKLPFVFAMAPFVSMRSFEQIRNDCSYNRNNVKIIAPC